VCVCECVCGVCGVCVCAGGGVCVGGGGGVGVWVCVGGGGVGVCVWGGGGGGAAGWEVAAAHHKMRTIGEDATEGVKLMQKKVQSACFLA